MTVAELIEKLREMPQEAEIMLEASFEGMCGSGKAFAVMLETCSGLVFISDEEMSRP